MDPQTAAELTILRAKMDSLGERIERLDHQLLGEGDNPGQIVGLKRDIETLRQHMYRITVAIAIIAGATGATGPLVRAVMGLPEAAHTSVQAETVSKGDGTGAKWTEKLPSR